MYAASHILVYNIISNLFEALRSALIFYHVLQHGIGTSKLSQLNGSNGCGDAGAIRVENLVICMGPRLVRSIITMKENGCVGMSGFLGDPAAVTRL